MKIVVALGGNALGNTPEEQKEIVKKSVLPIVELIKVGHDVVIVHGNGPQVGMINLAMETASKYEEKVTSMPLAECGAMSQGYIGYHLQQALKNELIARDIKKNVTTIITQVVVDKDDPSFTTPTKPIGGFYSEEEMKEITSKKDYIFVEDSGRGYRRVVPSPTPIDIVEKDTITELINKGDVVITCGGGGIPVVKKKNQIQGISAVIDKDLASAKLAEIIDAEVLIILTAVSRVAINYGRSNERFIDKMSVDEARQYIKEGHFAKGSMLPKIEAAINFVLSKANRQAIIGSLEEASEAIKGNSGTILYR